MKELHTPDRTLADVAELCLALGSDGLRGELTLLKAARAYAAWRDDTAVTRGMCAMWRRWRCDTGCAAIRWTRRERVPGWRGSWRMCLAEAWDRR